MLQRLLCNCTNQSSRQDGRRKLASERGSRVSMSEHGSARATESCAVFALTLSCRSILRGCSFCEIAWRRLGANSSVRREASLTHALRPAMRKSHALRVTSCTYYRRSSDLVAAESLAWNFFSFQYWAVPRGTAIRGQPVEGARQASASLPLDKNRDNLIAVRWTAF